MFLVHGKQENKAVIICNTPAHLLDWVRAQFWTVANSTVVTADQENDFWNVLPDAFLMSGFSGTPHEPNIRTPLGDPVGTWVQMTSAAGYWCMSIDP